jgi:hypothetical protein
MHDLIVAGMKPDPSHIFLGSARIVSIGIPVAVALKMNWSCRDRPQC